MRPGDERAIRLVEADVTVSTESKHHQVDSAGAGNRALEAIAFGRDVRRQSIEKMGAPRGNVHVTKQVAMHEAAIASGIAGRDAVKLVQIEGGRARKIDVVSPAQGDELAVKGNRRAASRQAQDQVRVFGDRSGNFAGQCSRRPPR